MEIVYVNIERKYFIDSSPLHVCQLFMLISLHEQRQGGQKRKSERDTLEFADFPQFLVSQGLEERIVR